jgi:hypothetical protein
LASEPEPIGCTFALLKGNDQKFLGISKDQIIQGVKASEDWQLQVEDWRHSIAKLAEEFTQGKAILHSFNTAQFNYQSDLIPFNRWNEQQDIQRLKEAKKG